MFGYVRPLIPELKVKELERFRAQYCGLCHELSRQYGLPARFLLNYDFVFLSMLLAEGEAPTYGLRRCPVHPLRRRCVCCTCPPLTRSAGYSVILAYRKLEDSRRDGGFWERSGAFWASLGLKRAYRKAAGAYPDFDQTVSAQLARLTEMEERRETSLDAAADTFAVLLAACAPDRVRRELLYHLGRVVYIADAWDDLEEDRRTGAYNPVALRYGLTGAPTEAVKTQVRETLTLSAGAIMAAFALLPATVWTPILENIIYAGLPDMIEQVLAGTYLTKTRGIPKGDSL